MTRPHVRRVGSEHLCEEAEREEASPVRSRCQTRMCALGGLHGGGNAVVCDLPKSAEHTNSLASAPPKPGGFTHPTKWPCGAWLALDLGVESSSPTSGVEVT